MFVVDTNVLVYAANEDAPESTRCRDQINAWREQASPWYLTWGVIYEFLRIVTHHRVLRSPWTIEGAWEFVSSLLDSPSLHVLTETDRHDQVLRAVVADVGGLRGNLLHDAHVATVMREHGIRRIVTRDGDFRRFPFLDVIDPLAGPDDA